MMRKLQTYTNSLSPFYFARTERRPVCTYFPVEILCLGKVIERESHCSHKISWLFCLNRLSALVNLGECFGTHGNSVLSGMPFEPCTVVDPGSSVAVSAWWYPCCGDYWGMLALSNSSGTPVLSGTDVICKNIMLQKKEDSWDCF